MTELINVTKQTPITLKLSDVTLRRALVAMLDQAGGAGHVVTYYVEDGIVEITSRDAADHDLVTRVYPVDDLLLVVPDFAGPTFNLQQSNQTSRQGGGGGGGSSGQSIFSGSGARKRRTRPPPAPSGPMIWSSRSRAPFARTSGATTAAASPASGILTAIHRHRSAVGAGCGSASSRSISNKPRNEPAGRCRSAGWFVVLVVALTRRPCHRRRIEMQAADRAAAVGTERRGDRPFAQPIRMQRRRPR